MSNRNFILASAAAGLIFGLLVYLLYSSIRSGDSPTTAASTLLTGQRPHSYHTGISRASPAVVSVYSSETIYRRTDPTSLLDRFGIDNSISPSERRQTNQGSGVIINEEGYVLTNNHLVQDADAINVALADGRLFTARIIGADPETDLSVIKIDTDTELPHCSLDHNSTIRVGDIVLAIGNPFGVGQTVTQGIVSATRRQLDGTSALQNFLQIDAAINPGNSGGALINPRGDLVGINTAIFSRNNGAQGIGFAIPSELIRQVVPEIIRHGRVIRGWLGINASNLQLYPDLYRLSPHGAVISAVVEGGPAHLAGLRRGDVLTHIHGEPIQNAQQLLEAITALAPGAVIQVSGMRQTQPFDLRIEVTERPSR